MESFNNPPKHSLGGGGAGCSYLEEMGAVLATTDGAQSGNSQVTIEAVLKPSTWAMLVGGFGTMIALRR